MMKLLIPQKRRKESHAVVVWPPKPRPSRSFQRGMIAEKKVCSASPPIQDWIPNHPQATSARINAGRFDPSVPYAARAKTGKGMPYFVPGGEFRRIGIRTIVLPSRMVNFVRVRHHPSSSSRADDKRTSDSLRRDRPVRLDLLLDHLLVPDHDDRGLVVLDVLLRHPLDVGRRHGIHAPDVARQIVVGQTVQVH